MASLQRWLLGVRWLVHLHRAALGEFLRADERALRLDRRGDHTWTRDKIIHATCVGDTHTHRSEMAKPGDGLQSGDQSVGRNFSVLILS